MLAHAQRHRVRARESAPGAAPELAGARRQRADRRQPRGALRPRGLRRVARASCATSARERGIVLIFDEVFLGFRLARGGAQEYFGVRADLVTYGKTLGGGLPVGVLCGTREFMKRFRDDRPTDVLLRARHVQLAPVRDRRDERVPAPARHARDRARPTSTLDARWNGRAAALNARLEQPRRTGARREPRLGLDDRCTRSRAATTGCSSSTCAPRAWRSSWVGSGPADLQPQLLGRGLSRPSPSASCARPRDARDGWWWSAAGAHEQERSAADPAGAAARALRRPARSAGAGRPSTRRPELGIFLVERRSARRPGRPRARAASDR